MVFIYLIFFLLSNVTLHAETKHMVSFGRDGFGWSGTKEEIETKNSSSFKDVDYFLNDIALNYAYRLNSRFQLGIFYQGGHSEYEFETRSASTQSVKIETNTTGLFFLINFSDDLNDAWYTGLGFSITDYEEENSKALQDAESKAPFELDDLTNTYEFFLGKRFSLRGFDVDNLAFSPQIRFFRRSHGKDFDDQKIGLGTGFSLQILRFDLLF